MGRQFVISHSHGYLRSFEKMLGNWDSEAETLVIMGNVNDYGHNSFLIYKRLLQLKEIFQDRVVFLKGKHELSFEKFISNPSIHALDYFHNGGLTTLTSFYEKGIGYKYLSDTNYLTEQILPYTDFTELELYNNLSVPYYETENSVFLSEEQSVLTTVMYQNWQNKKKLFITSQQDSDFQVAYWNQYLSEELFLSEGYSSEQKVLSDCFTFLNKNTIPHFQEKNQPQTIQKPEVMAHIICDGVVVSEIKLEAQD